MGKVWRAQEVVDLVESIHHTPEDLEEPEEFDEDEWVPDYLLEQSPTLLPALKEWDFYEERSVPISDLNLELALVDPVLVSDIIELYRRDLKEGTYPPIVLGRVLGKKKPSHIIDGFHRATALREIGETHVKALVGLSSAEMKDRLV